MKYKYNILVAIIYSVLTAAIVWQTFLLVRRLTAAKAPGNSTAMVDVVVEGNVRRPGRYRAVKGTTQFEILRVAGVRPTSDLSTFVLTSQIDGAATLNVGTMEKPVGVKDQPLTVRLEFFYGEISIISADGQNIPQYEGIALSEGTRIITETSSQAELSVGPYSRIDMDNFTELFVDKILSDKTERIGVELFQKNGACWYKVIFTKNNESFKINTLPVTITVAGTGADFLVDVQSDRLIVNMTDGLLLVERVGGGESVNMIGGQSATVYYDGRPFQISKLVPDVSLDEKFAQLSREKVNYLSRQMPLNILFCGTPAAFYFFSVQYERNTIAIVPLPGELLIDQFADGISTIDQSFLYGGPIMTSTLIERLLDTRIQKYILIDKNDIVKTAGVMGGIQVNVDQRAAGILSIASGKQKLSGALLVQYLSSTVSGIEDARRRQMETLRALFENLVNKSFIPTLIFADQLVSSTQTNFNSTEIINHYKRFSEKTNWQMRQISIPAFPVKRNNRSCLEPDIEKCRRLLISYE